MKYLLDTNAIIAMFRDLHGMRAAILKAGFDTCAISEITLAELLYGAYKGGYERHSHEVRFVKEHFKVIPISDSVIKYAQLRTQLEADGVRLDNFDLLIAATAITEGFTLITHNKKHFDRIPGLKIKDWER